MDIQKLAGIAIIILGLGLFFFAGKIFDSSSDFMWFMPSRFREWYEATLKVDILMIRIIGLMIAGAAAILL